jgi:hypothetical protein
LHFPVIIELTLNLQIHLMPWHNPSAHPNPQQPQQKQQQHNLRKIKIIV